MKVYLVIICVLTCGALAACGGGDGDSADAEAAARAEAKKAAQAQAARQKQAEAKAEAKADAREANLTREVQGVPKPPKFELPPGSPPKKVVIRDIRKGRGAKIEWGDKFSASYISLNYDKPGSVEDHWSTGPFNWYWDKDILTQGWEIGLRGMRVGGLRELLVPSKLAYSDGDRAYLIELLMIKDES